MRNAWILLAFILTSCAVSYAPDEFIKSEEEKAVLISSLHPYVLRKRDDVPLEARFSDSLKVYYADQAEKDELYLHSYYIDKKDSLHYFMMIRRDRKSLYIDYRAVGGVLKKNGNEIYDVELKFVTPMLRKDTIDRQAPQLFKTLVEKGNVEEYIGNGDYIDWPSKDVRYNKELRKWELKSDSEWNKVMEEAKKVEGDSAIINK